MTGEVLVLDNEFMLIDRIRWQDAITLFFLGKVEIISEYEDRVIRSVSLTIKMPAIVRYLVNSSSRHRRKRRVKFNRETIYERDHGKCAYCGKVVTRDKITFDHIVPRVMGGISTWTNVVICCLRCNQRKGGRTPEQANMKLLVKPRPPSDISTYLIVTIMRNPKSPRPWVDFLKSFKYWYEELDE